MRISERQARRRHQALGLVFIVLIGLFGVLVVAIYQKTFTRTVSVTLHTDRVGSQLRANADVKVRGVVVGEVRQVLATERGADIELSLDPSKVDRLPKNTSARLLPKTLFGQRYVSLMLPEGGGPALAAGDVIEQDHTEPAVELEKALRDLMPVLQAVQPQKLASTLGAVSQALEGRGKPLGESFTQLNTYLSQLNPKMPELQRDISKFADTLATYSQAGPDLIDALSDLTTTAKTLSEQKESVSALLSTVTTASGELDNFLRNNGNTLINLAAASRPTLELLARYSPAIPCLMDAVTKLKPSVERALGAGTNEPGLHVELIVKQGRGKYVPGRDRPVYGPGGGPRCYPVAAGAATPALLPNSPEERGFINEVLTPAMDTPPPSWSSLLVGPLLRGAEVAYS